MPQIMPLTQTNTKQPVANVHSYNDIAEGPSMTFMHIEQLHFNNCAVPFHDFMLFTHPHF